MIAHPTLPKFQDTERLVLALIVSAALHSLMLLGVNYHSGSGSRFHVASRPGGATPLQVLIDRLPASATEPAADEAIRVMQPDSREASPPPADPLAPQSQAAVKPAQGNPLLTPEIYLRAGELDVRPQIRDRVTPVYPESALDITGRVTINVFINASGNVDEVAVVRADPPGVFDDSAISAFRAARFTPGMKGHKAVNSLIVLEVNYDIADRQAAQSGAR